MIRAAVVVLCLAACSKSEPHAKPAPPPAKDRSCELAIVLDPTGVSIGTAAGACHAARVDGKPDLAWVESQLRDIRYVLADACPPEAVIVAETGPYQELISVMDIALKTGSIDVGVGDASDVKVPMAGATATQCKLPTPPKPVPKAVKHVEVEERPIFPPLSPEEVRKLTEQKPLELPLPDDKETVQQAPVIIVTKTEITYQGRVLASVEEVAKDPKALAPLAAVLRSSAEAIKHGLAAGEFSRELVKACDEAKQGIRPTPGTTCPEGLLVLQADQDTDMHVINALLHTAKDTGFDNLLFAVKDK